MLSITKVLNALLLIQIQVVYSWVHPTAILRCRLLNNPATNNCRLYSSEKESEEYSSGNEESEEYSSGKEESEEYSSGKVEEEDTWDYDDLEVLQGDGEDFYDDDTEEDWIPDGDLARRKPKKTHLTPANEVILSREDDVKEAGAKTEKDGVKNTSTPYTDEEEELIDAMGGKERSTSQRRGQREMGFLGDCTLEEIATDYSVPICYMADVLCMWGVPVPINIHDRLGDLTTGEQAFALVEAVNSLDVGVLQDRYSNQNLLQICEEWDIPLKDAFELAMTEGWNLPFGVRTNLRVEQEEELMRVFSKFYRE